MKTPSIPFTKLVTTAREAIDNALRSLHFIGLMIGLCPFAHEQEPAERR